MLNTEFGCLATIIGSMPHEDASTACSLILRRLKDIPAWPQLPRRSYTENMYVQYIEGFPGVVDDNGHVYVDTSQDISKSLETLYTAYLENNFDQYPTSAGHAAGLHRLLNTTGLSLRAVKGQITGPLTWGLTLTDASRRAVIYDEILGDAVPRFLRLKAAWQEKELKRICPDTIMFIDEPYMASFGSASISLSMEKVTGLLEEVLSGLTGLKGIHCCGNTDWPVLLATSVDIISFDTYNYAESLTLYPAEVKKFLDRKGAIAWGIVPSDDASLARESVASLKDRLEEAMTPFTRKGIPFRQLIYQGLLTPSCGLASLATEDAADQALVLLAELSDALRRQYI